MTFSLALDDRQFVAAMTLLEREQNEFLPSPAEIRWYYAFNAVTVIVAILFLSLAFDPSLQLLLLVAATTALNIALLVLNFRLVRKFWRLARLRRKLGLTRILAPFFVPQDGAVIRIFKFVAKAAWIVLGLLTLGFGAFTVIEGEELVGDDVTYLLVLISLLAVFLSVSLLSLPFMWRASKRLQVVAGLQDSLSRTEAPGSGDEKAEAFALAATGILGQMERSQIMNERRHNFQQAKRAKPLAYAVQASADARRARSGFDSRTSELVENQVIALAEDPFPEGTIEDEDSGIRRLKIPETSVEIGYEVDQQARSIKIYYLHSFGESDGGAPDNE